MKLSLIATALVAPLIVTGCFNNTPIAPEVAPPTSNTGNAMMDTMPTGSGNMGDPNMVGGDAVAPEGSMTPSESGSTNEPAMPRYVVADLPAFDAFIATKPTPEELKARYPELTLVLPGDIATKELRSDRSRYFAQLGAEGRIVGGTFQ